MPKNELTEEQRQYVEGFRALADHLEQHPELVNDYPSPIIIHRWVYAHGRSPDEVAAEVHELAEGGLPPGWSAVVGERYIDLTSGDGSPFAPHQIMITAHRDDVSRREIVASIIELAGGMA